MRTLAIDFGERRIGLALSDADGRFALPWKVLERRSDESAIATLTDWIRDEEVTALVVGLPHPPGDSGRAAAPNPLLARARSFGNRLAAATGLPVEWIDEAHTSTAAAERLREAGVDARRARGRLDAVAAQILLQEALDRRSAAQRAGAP